MTGIFQKICLSTLPVRALRQELESTAKTRFKPYVTRWLTVKKTQREHYWPRERELAVLKGTSALRGFFFSVGNPHQL